MEPESIDSSSPGDRNGQSSSARPRRLTRLYVATAVLVAAVSLVWSELSNDRACTERPCRQDEPLMLAAGTEVMLLLLYLAGLLALRRGARRQDDGPEH